MKITRKPYAGKLHVRIDEGGKRIEASLPPLLSTLPGEKHGKCKAERSEYPIKFILQQL